MHSEGYGLFFTADRCDLGELKAQSNRERVAHLWVQWGSRGEEGESVRMKSVVRRSSAGRHLD